MKIGVRKPSLSKSLKARTTSKWKRQMKKAVIPTYGQKGTGIIKNPKRALYNKVYNKTTVDAFGSMKKSQSKKQEQAIYTQKGRKFTLLLLGIFQWVCLRSVLSCISR